MTIETPDFNRLSKESATGSSLPTAATSLGATGGNVGRKIMFKMKFGGRKIHTSTKDTIDKAGSSGEHRFSGDLNQSPQNSDAFKDSLTQTQRASSGNRRGSIDIPIERRTASISEWQFGPGTYGEPERPGTGYGSQNIEPGLSTPTQLHAPTSVAQPWHGSRTPVTYSQTSLQQSDPYAVMGRPYETRRERSASGSGIRLARFFSQPSAEQRPQSANYGAQHEPQTSPKQKSKFSKFMSDLAQTSITGTPLKHERSESQSGSLDSPPPPLPPDISQSQRGSQSSGRFRAFFADLNSRDITGSKPAAKSKPEAPESSGNRTGSGGFRDFISDLNKRDISGLSQDERLEQVRRSMQENTHPPGRPVYHYGAPD